MVSDRGRPTLRVVGEGERRNATAWKCPACIAADRPSGPIIEIALDATISNGVVTPGERAFACLACHARGKLTIVA